TLPARAAGCYLRDRLRRPAHPAGRIHSRDGPVIQTTLERIARWLLAPLWAAEVARIGWPGLPIEQALLSALALYLPIAFVLARPGTRFLSGGLAAAAVLAALFGGSLGDLRSGFERALIFTAFIPTLAWLRAGAERSPAVAASRELFLGMPGRAREAGLQVGAHLLGAVITAGVFGLFAPLLGPGRPLDERAAAAQATVRGMCLAVLWSPCFVGMAVASRLIPEVALWQAIPVGLAFAVVALLLADLLFGLRRPGHLLRAAAGFRPILVPLALGAAAVLLLSALTPLSSLEAVLIALPPLGLAWLMIHEPGDLRPALAQTFTRLGRMGDDLLIVVVAMALASVLAGNTAIADALDDVARLALPAPAILAGTFTAMLALSFLGLHPMVSISVLIPLVHGLPGEPVAPLVLMILALAGWSLGTINSPSSLSIVLASTSFRVPLKHLLLGNNLAFVLAQGALTVLLLSLLNRALAG
ncbi:MAG: hypothetical protein R3349_06665, partial [Geminicoccaceae bacterium]|nr:hypothetical protein [Geminicoccaceae bacterium]